jgi:bacterioferritin
MRKELEQNLQAIRDQARNDLEKGAVTAAYGLEQGEVIEVLNDVLATEIVCALRYLHHYHVAAGIHGRAVAQEFREHADTELQHAHMVAERITQLGGTPDFNPQHVAARSHAMYSTGDEPSPSLGSMIRENLIAERVAVATYSRIVRWLGDRDPTTRRIMEELLANEEEHADDLAHLLASFKGGTPRT